MNALDRAIQRLKIAEAQKNALIDMGLAHVKQPGQRKLKKDMGYSRFDGSNRYAQDVPEGKPLPNNEMYLPGARTSPSSGLSHRDAQHLIVWQIITTKPGEFQANIHKHALSQLKVLMGAEQFEAMINGPA